MAEPQNTPGADTPKIVVDSDWKMQARAEKERLEAAEKQAAAKGRPGAGGPGAPGAGAAPGAGPGLQQGLPPADFQTLLGSMVSQALMYLGAFPDPETGRAIVSLDYARFHIDLLEVLEAKTKGNLTEDEAKDLNQALSELRLRFVEISKAVAQMVQKRAAEGGAGGAVGGGGGIVGGAGAGPALRLE